MDEILWKVPRAQIRLMMADRPQLIRESSSGKVKPGTKDKLNELF
jgi:hypothetical protein